MLEFLTKTVKKLVGSKSDRDIREIQPLVEKILLEYPKLQSLSNDELRQKTVGFKKRIQDHISTENSKIKELQEKGEQGDSLNLHEKEDIYKQIDELEKKVLEKIEEALMEVLPEAFAVVKETARRFLENEELVLTATDHDRDLAATRDSIIIDGDKAIYKTSGWQPGTRSPGTCSTTMCSLLAESFFTKARLQRWPREKVKHWLPPFQSI